LKSCFDHVAEVTLACPQGDHMRVFGEFRTGRWVYKDESALAGERAGSPLWGCLSAIGWPEALPDFKATPLFLDLTEDQRHTLGAWG
jgi:hypothetical protein